MPDDERDVRGPHQNPESGDEPASLQGRDVPASVMFSELMRQAAARSKPRPSVWADPSLSGVTPTNRTYNTRARLSGNEPPRPATPPMFEDEPVPPPPEEDAGDGDGGDDGNYEPPPPPPSQEYEDALEAQRVRRVKRRKTRAHRRTVGMFGGLFRSLFVVIAAAGLMATIFTWYTPSGLISSDVRQGLSVAIATSSVSSAPQPTAMPTPNWLRRIGIVSGHRGPENDPGAVCPDGLTEAEINFNVAQLVVRNLRGRGYTVDLLDEFDPRLDGYQAAALVSIHSNTCQEWPGEIVSGYLISAAAARVTARGNDQVLVDCVARHYGVASGLQRREGVTVDMTDYHTFREIHPLTPASILELGFMLADRNVLTTQPDALARGITDGILCFMEPGALPTPEPAPTAEAAV
jgi:N-acetylmuramoyl-L-alanine amidase